MSHVPDHTPAAAALEHAALIVALDAGDLAGRERDRASTLLEACAGCASLMADLAVLRAATAALPTTPRTRDYRLTDADATRLRPSAWRRLLEWFAAPRSTVPPLAGGLVALGIAGLLLTTSPGLLGQAASTRSTTTAPVAAPGDARLGAPGTPPGAAATTGPAATNESVAAPPPGSAVATPKFAAAPAASPEAVSPADASPLAVAVPAPSGAAVTVPAPTAIPVEIAPPGRAGASAPVTSGQATDAGPIPPALEAASPAGPIPPALEAASPAGSQGDLKAAAPTAREVAQSDRTLPLAISLVLLAAGIALFVANRVLRRRTGL
jgi:hypothetical protein